MGDDRGEGAEVADDAEENVEKDDGHREAEKGRKKRREWWIGGRNRGGVSGDGQGMWLEEKTAGGQDACWTGSRRWVAEVGEGQC